MIIAFSSKNYLCPVNVASTGIIEIAFKANGKGLVKINMDRKAVEEFAREANKPVSEAINLLTEHKLKISLAFE